jgi:hypothetical protein
MGSDGARYLAAALERNKTLKTLALNDNNIGADGARHLPVRNRVLGTFWLDGINIGMMEQRLRIALERNNNTLLLSDNICSVCKSSQASYGLGADR